MQDKTEHIVKSFEDELRGLDGLIAQMGGLAEEQFSEAIDAMIRRDVDTAMGIKKSDKNIYSWVSSSFRF